MEVAMDIKALEANRRLLAEKAAAVDARLTSLAIARGHNHKDKELLKQQWEAKKEKAIIEVQLREVKAQIKQENVRNARMAISCEEQIDDAAAKIVHCAHAVNTVIYQLKERAKELIEENRALYIRVMELETALAEKNAPGQGREVWRDENYDHKACLAR